MNNFPLKKKFFVMYRFRRTDTSDLMSLIEYLTSQAAYIYEWISDYLDARMRRGGFGAMLYTEGARKS